MALINCPECGRENVSDSAEMCPTCGFSIKSYYDNIKQEEEEKRLAEEREKQRFAEIEKQKELQEEREKKKQERKERLFGSPAKKIAWVVVGCIVLALLIIIGMLIHKENEVSEAIKDTQKYCDWIRDDVSDLQSILNNIDFVYGSSTSNETIENIEDKLVDISIYMRWVDSDCHIDTKVINSLNSYVSRKTSYKTWDEYKQSITNKYFIGDTTEDSANKLVKANAYSSSEQRNEAIRNSSVIVSSLSHSTSGKNYHITGTVTNNTSRTVEFVKVKISMLDSSGKVIDTDTTYACGSEGLAPGESSKFDCYIDKDSQMDSITAGIYDYD